jgi:hypothetical protein
VGLNNSVGDIETISNRAVNFLEKLIIENLLLIPSAAILQHIAIVVIMEYLPVGKCISPQHQLV